MYSNSYTYDLDKLKSITHNGFSYEFTYDVFGNPSQVKVAGATLITNTYQSNNGLLETSTYGNGAVVSYEYDEYHRVITKSADSVLKFEYTYDNRGNLSSVIDHSGSTDVTYSYFYDFMNRLTKVNGSNTHKMLFTYDSYGRVDSLTNTINGTSYKNEYDYGDKNVEGEIPGLIYNVKLNGTTQLSYAFDQLARLSTRTLATTTPFTTTYTYLDGSGANSTTTLLASMTNGTNAAFNYTYDSSGNILTITEGATLKASYTYDKMNQLISENNAYSSKSIDYVYDIGGNITSRTEYNYTNRSRGSLIDTYTYGYSTTWKDQMTSYDEQTITYDSIGNPLTYRNGISFSWTNGRELASYTKSGVTTNYTYNDSGIRTSKKIGNNAATNYYLNGSSIVRQVTGDKILDFFYDENGNLYGFKEDGAMYYYVRNGQSDIIGILDSTGLLIASYVYDSWGNLVNKDDIVLGTVAYDNPFRYRGYYFDSDTELYYLNSRYYDSTVGRFINADGLVKSSGSILGTSMYGYCENNPIVYHDPSGFLFMVLDQLESTPSISLNQNTVSVETNTTLSDAFALGNTFQTSYRTGLTSIGSFANLTVSQTVVFTGCAYAFSTPFAIAAHMTDPYLTTNQKWELSGMEVTLAGGGIYLAWAVANFWNPSGWVALTIGVAYAYGAYEYSNDVTKSYQRDNGKIFD